jgi:hypothetical protein
MGACPKCAKEGVQWQDNPHRCERGASKKRLVDDGEDEWWTWDAWTARDCRYCRFSRDAALRCVEDKRVMVVGDSVTMQFCNFLACANAGAGWPYSAPLPLPLTSGIFPAPAISCSLWQRSTFSNPMNAFP